MPVMCLICDKLYSKQSNLNRHCRNEHGIQKQEYSYHITRHKFKCFQCKCSYAKSLDLCDHLRKKHNKKIDEEKLSFESLEDFQSWKYDVEQRELCNYVFFGGKNISSPSFEVQYLVCNRRGTIKNEIAMVNRKRNIKTQGFSKLGYNCISRITVKKNNSKFDVHRIITYYGHSTDIEHLRISNTDKKQIASKLVEGVSIGRILDDTRNNICYKRKRIDLLTKQDMNNIKRSYNIHNKEGVKHKNDVISVEIWVEECKSLENNPVLLYKPQGEPLEHFENSDFCLIIMNDLQESLLKQFGGNILAIDSTHGLNNYDFELTTLMIVDEFNEGFPIAFMFTNKKDTFINNIFFSMIKQKVGTIKSNTFMSDITGTFYNGWVQVMGSSNHQLYCSWHIDRAWRSNLGKISNKEKRVWVYKTLKYLQRTTDFNDANAFCEHLQVAIKNMLDDVDTKIFGEYFLKKRKKKLKEISNLQILVNNEFAPVSDSVFQQVISNLHTAKNLLQLPSTSKPVVGMKSFKDKKELSACQNIVPQKRFFSTQKKKKKTKEAIKNPNMDEKKEISATLNQINILHISTNSAFDHNYK